MDKGDKVRIFAGIDIGGTLTKLCIWFKTPCNYSFENIDDLKIPFKKGEILFRKCNNKDIKEFFDLLHKVKEEFDIDKIYVTGGGAYKYEKELREVDENYNKLDEMSSLMKGLGFLNKYVKSFAFSNKAGKIYHSEPSQYPYILCNIGSGVSVVKFNSDEEHERIGGTSLGGGTFLGMCNLALGIKSFDEAIALANKG